VFKESESRRVYKNLLLFADCRPVDNAEYRRQLSRAVWLEKLLAVEYQELGSRWWFRGAALGLNSGQSTF
jgi:hypothetical protein